MKISEFLVTKNKIIKIISIFIIIFSFTYIDIISASLNLFKCLNVGDAHNSELRLISDFSINC